MIKVIEIRKILQTHLTTIHERVFYEDAPTDAVYPYVVYNLPTSIDSGALEQFVLDIDAWDNVNDTTALETLIDTIDVSLHRKTVSISGTITATFYRQTRLSLNDDDPAIRRRKYVYEIRTHK